MKDVCKLFVHCLAVFMTLLRPGGFKSIVAENLVLKQQLITLNRGRKRAPNFTVFDRLFFGFLTQLVIPKRLTKIAVILKPATLIKFHQALVKKKYQALYGRKMLSPPGRRGPSEAVIQLVIEMKQRNPGFGYQRIAMQIYQSFGIDISRFAVGRILRKARKHLPTNDGPSWLTFIGHLTDHLWSVDLFRCESILLKSHWVMIALDQYTRRIIGFAVHRGDPTGLSVCLMLIRIKRGYSLPKYLSTDNDPLFKFDRWQANLRILDIEEIKSVPGTPTSHPFIERAIGTCRREYLDQTLFWNEQDLQRKLAAFQTYYNEQRGHMSLAKTTPNQKVEESKPENNLVHLNDYRWKSHCGGLFKLPMAA